MAKEGKQYGEWKHIYLDATQINHFSGLSESIFASLFSLTLSPTLLYVNPFRVCVCVCVHAYSIKCRKKPSRGAHT
jgi:hypothetical protein